jgi:two-component system C4-dicarboxylate transport response regulator DctD
MPLALQVKFLRVLQDRSVVPLGANEPRAVDVRIVAATKEDLRQASGRGTFRADLFYRLNVLTLTIPPLRQRKADIPLLFQLFAGQSAARFKRDPEPLTPAVLARLVAYDWPGNVRELQNTALRAVLGLELDIPSLAGLPEPSHESDCAPLLAARLIAVERQIIADTLRQHNNSMKATYEALGISRKTLYDKLRRYGLGKPPPEDDGCD